MDLVSIHVDRDGVITARLRDEGKMDTTVQITAEQLPWFNALRYLLRRKGVRNG